MGAFFRSDRIEALAAVLSGILLLRALTVVPDALLQRRFSFARRVAVDPLGAVAFAAVSIVACAQGAGAWGLVAGAYASMLTQVISGWGFARFRPRRRLASVRMWRELASFARHILGSEILSRVAMQLDAVVLGRFAGAGPLGQYRNGLRLAQQPSDAFVNVGAYVLLPALSRMADEPARLRSAAVRTYSVVAAAALPVSFALLPLGEPLAVLLLGSRWKPAGHAIAGLCGLLIAQAMISVSSEIFKAVGRPQILVRLHLVSLCTIVVFLTAAGIPFGLIGVAVAVSVSQLLTAAYALFRVGPLIELGRPELRRVLAGPTIATAVMVLAMFGVSAAVNPLDHAPLLRWALMLAEAGVGAIAYVLMLLAVDAPRRRAAGDLLARFRDRRHPLARAG
jgi:PST family polysaccharide transporter